MTLTSRRLGHIIRRFRLFVANVFHTGLASPDPVIRARLAKTDYSWNDPCLQSVRSYPLAERSDDGRRLLN